MYQCTDQHIYYLYKLDFVHILNLSYIQVDNLVHYQWNRVNMSKQHAHSQYGTDYLNRMGLDGTIR